uniref:Retrovirus-related Pol polyprotein from transposon TNT 1-94 n=1 Tax=Tanacetum cinerariifolium TaxID=118510 RepID=A0A6L2LCF5_TANCI|nr:retrovirus-related Pol polyprotein from transposon TNT 1-94 [Tanacetum cinerariifolium]
MDEVSYHKLFDILKQYQKEVNELRAERLAREANPLALVVTAQANQDPYYQISKSHKSHALSSKPLILTKSHTTTRYKGKEIAKPITPPSETASEEDNDPKQAQRDKDMQKNLALIAKYVKKIYKPTNNNLRTSSNSRNKNVDTTPRYKNDNQSGQFRNQRTVNVAGAREKPKRVKDFAYHKEKMLMCKQVEQGVPLQAEQYDWLAEKDEEVDEQELEAHYSYMAKIQEVPTADSGTDSEPVEQVQNDAGYNVFANDLQHYEKSESTKQAEFEKYKAFNDRTIDYDKLELVKEKHDELMKQSLLTKSHYEGLVKKKTKVITDLKLREERDIDKMLSMEKQLKFLNAIVYKRSQSIQTILMMAPKVPTYNGRPTFSNLRYLKHAQSEIPCLYAFPYDQSTHANRLIPNEETLALKRESRSKLYKDLVRPYDYTTLNSLYDIFKPPTQENEIQLAHANEIRRKTWQKSFVKSKPNIYKNVGFLPVSKSIRKSRQTYNLMINNINHFKEIVDNAWIKHSKDQFRAPTAQDMKILIQTCLMPLANKTQNDSFRFVHELKQEIYADLKYVESLEKEIDELESDKAEFSNMYDVILQEFKGKSMDTKFDKPYVIRQPNAQRIPKPSVLGKPSPFSNSLERMYFPKTKSVPTTNVSEGLSKPVTAQTLPQTARQVVSKTNVLKPGMYRIDNMSTQTRAPQLPQTVRNTNTHVSTSTGVNLKTNVSRPQYKSNQSRDKVLPNNSQVKLKKTQVEVNPKIPSVSNKMKSVTACKDSLNSRTLNANAICATCNKCLVDSNHFDCVTKMLNDINARAKKPNVVPISTRKPKIQANKLVATHHKKKIMQLMLFIVDSGCTKHMTGKLKLLCNFVKKFMGTICFGNDQFVPILGYEDLVQGNVTINRVYYVKGLNHNLFSVGQFCDTDLEVAFWKYTCFVRDLQGNDLLIGNHGSDLYIIPLQESTSSTLLCLMAKSSPTQAWLWHRRLSHLNFDYINLLSKKDIVIGLPKLKYVKSKAVPSSKGRLN